jgi:hypothetical protein
LLHQLKGNIVNVPGEVGKMTEVMANEREIGFFDGNALKPCYSFNCPGIVYVASQTVYRIRRKDNNPLLQDSLLSAPACLRIIGMVAISSNEKKRS